MKAASLLGICALLGLASAAHAECAYPKSPDAVPDGSTASEQEMVAAMGQFKQYNSDVEAYLKCLDDETATRVKDAGGSTGTILQIKAMQSKKHNSAVDELQTAATKFNAQIRAFKSKKG
jgi:ABC-type Fe3+ transport system substrate-binding protein